MDKGQDNIEACIERRGCVLGEVALAEEKWLCCRDLAVF